MEAVQMNDKKSKGNNPGVACDVSACKYNTIDCRCCAGRISVQNEKAASKGETYCSTFCPRGTS
jgi:hypothetical protein